MKTPELNRELSELAQELLARNWQMGTAESCTGGAIATACTDIPGSSSWFAGAMVVYTIPWKEKFLGVPASVIEEYGVVSEPTVDAMLTGLAECCGVPCGIAVSGIAGPTGAEPGKPVGTVVVGVMAGKDRIVETCHFDGDRENVRSSTVSYAISTLVGLLNTQKTPK